MTNHNRDLDPLECREMLAAAMADPSLSFFQQEHPADSTNIRAACALAVSIGRCRLFGVDTSGELDVSLPLSVALVAVQELNLHACGQIHTAAIALPSQLNQAIAIEAEDLCAELLEGRLNLWAAQIALCESYRAHTEDVADSKKLAGGLDYLVGELRLVDESLHAVAVELTLATSGYLLENLRACLSPEYAEAAPWWLAGELEELAAELEDAQATPWVDESIQQAAMEAMSQAKIESEPVSYPFKAATDEHDIYGVDEPEEEMAIAADGGESTRPTPAEERTIKYLTANMADILRRGDGEVWFAVDSDGSFVAHTYDSLVASGYAKRIGPKQIPVLQNKDNKDVHYETLLMTWLLSDLGVRRTVAESVRDAINGNY